MPTVIRVETTTRPVTAFASAPYFSAKRYDVTAIGIENCKIRTEIAISGKSNIKLANKAAIIPKKILQKQIMMRCLQDLV